MISQQFDLFIHLGQDEVSLLLLLLFFIILVWSEKLGTQSKFGTWNTQMLLQSESTDSPKSSWNLQLVKSCRRSVVISFRGGCCAWVGLCGSSHSLLSSGTSLRPTRSLPLSSGWLHGKHKADWTSVLCKSGFADFVFFFFSQSGVLCWGCSISTCGW